MNEKYTKYALGFKALSDPNRLIIINYLLDGELCACKILEQLNISQSTLSYHMKILCESAIVTARKEGKWMHYSLNREEIENLKTLFENYLKESLESSRNCSCK